MSPKVMLFDEPTSALDTEMVKPSEFFAHTQHERTRLFLGQILH